MTAALNAVKSGAKLAPNSFAKNGSYAYFNQQAGHKMSSARVSEYSQAFSGNTHYLVRIDSPATGLLVFPINESFTIKLDSHYEGLLQKAVGIMGLDKVAGVFKTASLVSQTVVHQQTSSYLASVQAYMSSEPLKFDLSCDVQAMHDSRAEILEVAKKLCFLVYPKKVASMFDKESTSAVLGDLAKYNPIIGLQSPGPSFGDICDMNGVGDKNGKILSPGNPISFQVGMYFYVKCCYVTSLEIKFSNEKLDALGNPMAATFKMGFQTAWVPSADQVADWIQSTNRSVVRLRGANLEAPTSTPPTPGAR